MGKIRLFMDSNKSAIYLLRYIVLAIFLTIIVIGIDYFGIGKSLIPEILLTKIDVARSILTALSGSFLTITTFTFSTILSVLSTYSSNYSPRVVENFLAKKITMKVMGLFVGGFIYSVLTLFFMKTSDLDVMVLSATVAIVYTIYSVVNFVIFIFSVSSLIQSGNLIVNTFRESEAVIDRSIEEIKEVRRIKEKELEAYHFREDFCCDGNGFLELIELEDFLKEYKDQEGVLVIHPFIGDFVSRNDRIASLYYNDWSHLAEGNPEDIKEKVFNSFTIKEKRITTKDYKYSIQKIIDIALRAISPGINDPNTAIKCIDFMGVLLGKISSVEGCYNYIQPEGSRLAVIYESFNLKKDIEDTLNQVVFYGKADVFVVSAIMDALIVSYKVALEENKAIIREYSQYVYDRTKDYFQYEQERKIIDSRYEKLNFIDRE